MDQNDEVMKMTEKNLRGSLLLSKGGAYAIKWESEVTGMLNKKPLTQEELYKEDRKMRDFFEEMFRIVNSGGQQAISWDEAWDFLRYEEP